MWIPRVCVYYGTRTRFANTNAPDVSHYSIQAALVITATDVVPGQFGAGQFRVDNWAQDNSARTIRRYNSSRTIRRKVYIINFLENLASSNILFINPASIQQ